MLGARTRRPATTARVYRKDDRSTDIESWTLCLLCPSYTASRNINASGNRPHKWETGLGLAARPRGQMPKSAKRNKQPKAHSTPYSYEAWRRGPIVTELAKRANDKQAIGGMRAYVSYTCPHGCGAELLVADPARGLHTAVDDHRRVCPALSRAARPAARGAVKRKKLAEKSDALERSYAVLEEMYTELIERRHDNTYTPPPPPTPVRCAR